MRTKHSPYPTNLGFQTIPHRYTGRKESRYRVRLFSRSNLAFLGMTVLIVVFVVGLVTAVSTSLAKVVAAG